MKDFSRIDRLSSQISRDLAEILRGHRELPPGLIISITEIELSKDLRHGKVFYSVYGDDDSEEKASQFFELHLKQIRKELAKKIRIRFMPELSFHYDPSIERSQRISELLDQIKKDNEKQQ